MELPRHVCHYLKVGFPLWISLISSASAQILPDTTLPNPSTVNRQERIQHITGGTEAGANLFHSFEQLNVATGETAYFDNALTIDNIITRVTGGQMSHIDGLIRTNGTANLFLLNPNGIVFGENAQLDIGGSFFSSTADRLIFEDGSAYSATEANAPPLLTLNIPIGLQMGVNPGSLVNRSSAPSAFNSPIISLPFALSADVNFAQAGLEVRPGQTLALVGGDIQLIGGNLTAPSGQIFLGSFTHEDLIEIAATPVGWNFHPNDSQHVGNISLSEGSFINTGGIGSGAVAIDGGNVTLKNSRIFALTLGEQNGRGIEIDAQRLHVGGGSQIFSFTQGAGNGGNIKLQTTETVELEGLGFTGFQDFVGNFLLSETFRSFDPRIVLGTETRASGEGGSIVIETGNLVLREGTLAGSTTFGSGDAGRLTLRADRVEVVGSGINTGAMKGSIGAGGDIEIDAQRLILRDGGALGSLSFSQGNSGNVGIRATESVEILTSPPGAALQTSIGTNTIDPQGIGKGGDITIETQRLIVADGGGIASSSGAIVGNIVLKPTGGPGGNLTIRATESVDIQGVSPELLFGRNPSFLTAQTTNSSPGGDIDIATPVLRLQDGGIVTAASFGAGNAGNIHINADLVEVVGNRSQGQFPSKIEASAGSVFSLAPNPAATGNAGRLSLNVERLTVSDGATVNVEALGTGNAGELNVVANDIFIDNQGSINASTNSGDQGNINLQAQNLLLRHASRIQTNAGNSVGGNIEIDTQTLTALEDSDISANSESFKGGRVTIFAQGIFATEFRLFPTPDSDITATGGTPELNGMVELNTPEIDSTAGLVELSSQALDVFHPISQDPCRHPRNSSFIVIGRGGLSDDPRQFLQAQSLWTDWRDVQSFRSQTSTLAREPSSSSVFPPLIEAQGWVKHPDGTVELVAQVLRPPEIGFPMSRCGAL